MDAQARIDELELQVAALLAENAKLKARLGVVPAADESLKVFPNVESIVWERYEDNAATRSKFNNLFMTWAMLGSKPNDPVYPPTKNVIVEGEGEIRRVPGGWNAAKNRGGIGAPDWYCIAVLRIVNVLAEEWTAYVQAGDDSNEEDRPDQEELIRRYARKGYGFRYAPAEWKAHSRGVELAKVYQTVREFPKADYRSKRIEIAPAP